MFLYVWTTGPPHDLQIREVRNDSLVLLWKPPVYQGRDPVNGFYIDIKEAEAPEEAWRGVNTKATEKTYLKVVVVISSFIFLILIFILTCVSSQYVISFFSFFLQIKNLKEGETYVFRVRAQNKAGVGKTSEVTEPVPALTKPGRRNKDGDHDENLPNHNSGTSSQCVPFPRLCFRHQGDSCGC